ncbi:hypothetical protein WMF04_50025 [Sorangium sp. So ce260]|uniref:hypothetical protein n=1 Tax=Sorangium sp. So ce260 TaxID=3133291 RepID=UPI003F634176
MHAKSVLSAVALTALMIAGGSLAAGCKSTDEATVTEESVEAVPVALEEPLTEEHDGGSVGWEIAPDGAVRAIVRAPDGKPIDKDVSGTLTWKGPNGDAQVPLALDAKTGLLVAAGPKLEADLTEVKYDVVVAGKPWNGTLHVPAGGTRVIVEGARKAEKRPIPAGKTGPNGGVIQVVGDDTIEVVADKASGQVRVYVLDANLKPIPVGDRKIKLGFVGPSSEVVVLTPGPGGLYCVGTIAAKVNPVKLTVVVAHPTHADVVLVGYRPGVHVVVGPSAPALGVVVATGWNVSVKVKTTPGVVVVHDDDDDDDDDGRPVHIHVHGKHKHRHKGKHGHAHGHWK